MASGPTLIDTKLAAQLLMVTERRVQQLASEGWIKKSSRGQWDLIDVVQGYIKFLKDDSDRNARSHAAARASEARTNEINLKIAQRTRELVPLADYNIAQDFLITGMRAELAGLPARVTRDLNARRDIETELNASINRLADRAERAGTALEEGGDISETLAAHGSG